MVFKVVSVIVKDKEVVGYKIHKGFSLYYITPTLYKEAIIMGLVKEQDSQVDLIDYNQVKTVYNDGLAQNKLDYALKSSSLERLRKALELNEHFTKVDLEIYEMGRKIVCYRVDASINSIEQLYQYKTYLLHKDFNTLYSLINFFCNILCRQNLNIDNILDFLEEEKGSSVFTCYVYKNGKDKTVFKVI